jgi:hypothetical protein
MSKPATETLSVVAKRTSKKSAKVAKKAAARRVAARRTNVSACVA